MNEHMKALLEGTQLSVETQEKVGSIFEAAVNARLVELQSSFDTQVAEIRLETEASILEATATAQAAIDAGVTAGIEESLETINDYLNYVVKDWVNENRLAIEGSLKVDQAEKFLRGMASVAESFNVRLPEGAEDLLESTKATAIESTAKLDEQITKNIQLTNENELLKRAAVIADACSGLSDSQAEKIVEASKGLSFVDIESFEVRMKDLVESYFPDEAKDNSETVIENVVDEEVVDAPKVESDGSYLSFLASQFPKKK